jgi:hypothetical protein
MILLGLLLMPFIIGAVAFLVTDSTISWKEYAVMTVASSLIALGGYQIAKYGAMRDTEHWNGHITDKRDGTTSCCHCHEECDTCYDSDGNSYSCNCKTVCSHTIDYYWLLDVSTGDALGDGCIHQSSAPDWYDAAYVGEPAAVSRDYTNYLKADPDSLMTPGLEEYMGSVPAFPEIYGMYHVKRVITNGVSVPRGWQDALNEMNDRLGAKHQVDILIVLTPKKDPEFARAIEAKWLYGPKNALTIVLGVPDGQNIEWARVVSLSEVNALKIDIRDELPGKSLNDAAILPFIENQVVTHFTRTPMSEYEYLATAARPTKGWTIFLYILNLLVIIGLSVWMHKEDIFGDERYLARKAKRPGRRFKFSRKWRP